jgi:glycosyltransferase involved in cell wall biosynthesis
MLLSVLMPVYNEKKTLNDILDRVLAVPLPPAIRTIEIVAVDDGSSDGSRDILQQRAKADPRIRAVLHEKNQGKGAALRTAIREARGDIAVFQDADLEYDPNDYARLLHPILEKDADVVYGSRFAASEYRRVLFFWHGVANHMLTLCSNMLSGLNLTDMETCYKAFRISVLKTLPIRSNGFGIEPEITAKIAKRKLVIFEVPISYAGRTYAEGKKIGMKDAFAAVWTMFKYKVVDDLYEKRYGEAILRDMELATRFTNWVMTRLDGYLTGTILEVGAGIGNNVRALLHKDKVIATDADPEYVRLLAGMFRGSHTVEVRQWDVTKGISEVRSQKSEVSEGQQRAGEGEDRKPETGNLKSESEGSTPSPLRGEGGGEGGVRAGGFLSPVDSILCSNVLEHIKDEHAALRNMHAVLKPGGRLVLVVPAGRWLYGSMDRVLGHCRRYTKPEVTQQLTGEGFVVEDVFSMNKPGVLGWFMNGKVFQRKTLGKIQMKLFNALVPVFKILDPILPWTGLSLVVVARKREDVRRET